MHADVQGVRVYATGIADSYSLAATKARSELVERIVTSDLMNSDVTGLFTYKTPTQWCSTGAAAHPDRYTALEKSTAEIVERDAVACWLSFSTPCQIVEERDGVQIVRITTPYRGWFVCVAIRDEGDQRQLTGAAARRLHQAVDAAYLEAFVRTTLPVDFLKSRLPAFVYGDIVQATHDAPTLLLREWKVDDLNIVKQFSKGVADFRRGIPAVALSKYQSMLGEGIWQPQQLQRDWYC